MKLVICLAVLFIAANASVINRRETQTDLGGQINGELQTVLQQIETAVDQGKTVAHDLLDKGHTLLQQAKTIGGQVWHAAQGELAKLTDSASGIFGGFLKGVSNIWHEVQHIFGRRALERRFLLDDLKAFNQRLSHDMQKLFHDIGTHVHDFNTYLNNVFQTQLHNAQPVIDNVKGLAENFLNATAAKSKDVIKQAQTFFEPYKHDLGELWTEIECEYNHILHAGPACATKRSVERRFLLDDLKAFNQRLSHDMQKLFHDIGTHVHDFNTYLNNVFQTQLHNAQPVIDNVKGLAENFLNATAAKSKDVIKQAQTFFEPYKHDLGELWTEIECEYNHILHAGPACATKSRRATVSLEAEIKKVIADIEAAVANGGQVAGHLLEKGKTLLEEAKKVGGQVWENSKGELGKLKGEASTVLSTFLSGVSHLWQDIHTAFGKRETQTEIGAKIDAELKHILQQIETTVTDGKQVAHDLLDKGKTVLAQAKEIGGQVWHSAQGELAKLNDAASGVFANFLKTASNFWHEISHVFGKRSVERRFLLDDLKAFNQRLSHDMQKLFHDIGTHVHDFNTYLNNVFQTQLHNAQPVIDNVKGLAENFLNATAAKSKDVIKQAQTFFEPYKHDLGELWTEIECEYNHILHAGPACATKRSVERRFLLDDLKAFNQRLSHDMQKLFHDIGTHVHDFNTYLNNVFQTQLHNAQPVIDNVKGLAENFLNATAAKSKDVIKQAQTFFEPYKHDLGELWTEIECEYNHILHGGPACATKSRRATVSLEAEIKKVIADIEAAVANGGQVAGHLLEKGKTLLEEAKKVGGEVWANSKGELSKLKGEASTVLGTFLSGVSHLWQDIHTAFGKRETQTEIGAKIDAELKHILQQIETTVTDGKQVAHDLLDKGKTVLAQAKEIGGQVWHSAQGELAKLNDAASDVFSNFLKTASNFWHEISHVFGKRETQTEIGAKIDAELKHILQQIETTVTDGKQVAHDLLDKGKTVLAQAKEIGGQVWHSAQGELAKLNDAASDVFSNFLKTASNFWHEISHVFGKREMERRFLLETFTELTSHLGQDLKNIFSKIGTKFHDFNQYLVNQFKKEAAAAKPTIDNIKSLAHNFLTATQSKTQEVMTQAKAFFEPYKHDLGELWGQIECTYSHVVHNTDTSCHETATPAA